MPEPWYRDGLRFACEQCGACCTGDPGVVWVNQAEVKAVAEFLHLSEAEVRAQYTRQTLGRRSLIERPNGDCTFFDHQHGCRVYPVRPRQCRSWPFWPSNLGSPETWQEVCQVCPGAGRGQHHTLDEVSAKIVLIEI